MNPQELAQQCEDALARQQRITLTTPIGFKFPMGFPRGELLSTTPRGNNYSYSPGLILRFLRNNHLIGEKS